MKVPTKVMRLKKYFVDTFTKKVIMMNPLKYKGLFLMHLGVIAVSLSLDTKSHESRCY